MITEFQKFPKIPRYSRECIITEKIDGTNGQIYIVKSTMGGKDIPNAGVVLYDSEIYLIFAGSPSRWLTLGNDNHGFCAWVYANGYALVKGLGEGRHYGEWFGKGIQRGYGLDHNRFALFDVIRWDPEMYFRYKVWPWESTLDSAGNETKRSPKKPAPFSPPPKCCHVVPVLDIEYSLKVDCWQYINKLKYRGSYAVPGYNNPEGIVIYHTQGNVLFKRTIDDEHKDN